MLESMDGILFTVDTFEGSPTTITEKLPPEKMFEYARSRLSRFKDRGYIIRLPSVEASTIFYDGSLDFVFIDAAHDYENVKNDILAWLPKLKPTGVMAGHDFDKSSPIELNMEYIVEKSHMDYDPESGVHCGVIRAVSECFEKVTLQNDPDSTIWSARPEWLR